MGFSVGGDSDNPVDIQAQTNTYKSYTIFKKSKVRATRKAPVKKPTYYSDYFRDWENRGIVKQVRLTLIGVAVDDSKMPCDKPKFMCNALYDDGFTETIISVGTMLAIIDNHMPEIKKYMNGRARQSVIGRFHVGAYDGEEFEYRAAVKMMEDDIKASLGANKQEEREINIQFNRYQGTPYQQEAPIVRPPNPNCPYCRGKGILYKPDGSAEHCVCMK